MTFPWLTSAQEDPIRAVQESPQDVMGVETGRAAPLDEANAGWILQVASTGQVRCRITAPLTKQSQDPWLAVLWSRQGSADLSQELAVGGRLERDGFGGAGRDAVAAALAEQGRDPCRAQDPLTSLQADGLEGTGLHAGATAGAQPLINHGHRCLTGHHPH